MHELTSVELWRIIIAMFLGGILIGYLLTSWRQDELLDRAERKLKESATTIEELVASNDAADSLIEKLRSNVQVMDDNAVALLTKNTELTRENRRLTGQSDRFQAVAESFVKKELGAVEIPS